jgi:ankyrin repeat protein
VPCSFVLKSFVLGTPLHSAAVGGSVEVIEKIVRFAVDNNFEVAELMGKKLGGQTPVHLAARHGHADAVAALLKVAAENGIDRSWLLGPDNCGSTPYDVAKTQSVINALFARYS